MTKKRELPFSLDAEASILGGILLRNETLARLESLEADDFYDPRHRAVFAAIRELEAKKIPIDVATLEAALEHRGQLESMGGVAFLGELALRVPTPDNVAHYADKVVQPFARARRIAEDASELIEDIYRGRFEFGAEGGESLVDKLDEARLRAMRRMPVELIDMAQAIKDEAKATLEIVDQRERDPNASIYVGVPCGIASIDDYLGGLPVGVPIVIASRPGGCKTTSMIGILDYMAAYGAERKKGLGALMSNEDRKKGFAQRMLGRASGIDTRDIIRARLSDVRSEFLAGLELASNTKLKLAHIHGWTMAKVTRLAKRIAAEFGLVAWGVDFVQRVKRPPMIKDRVEGIAESMNVFADVAGELGELGTVSILASQLRRSGATKKDGSQAPEPPPSLERLKGAGDIEEAGKVILAYHDPWEAAKKTLDPCSYCGDQKGRVESCVWCGGTGQTRKDPDTDEPVYHWQLDAHLLKNHQGKANVVFPLWWDRGCHRILGVCKKCRRAPVAPGELLCAPCVTGPPMGSQTTLGGEDPLWASRMNDYERTKGI